MQDSGAVPISSFTDERRGWVWVVVVAGRSDRQRAGRGRRTRARRVQAAQRSYRWWRPPTSGIATMSPPRAASLDGESVRPCPAPSESGPFRS
jgi:hypothetical protein